MKDTLNVARTSITALALALSMTAVPVCAFAAEDATAQSTATTSEKGSATDGTSSKSRDVGKDATGDQTGTSTDASSETGRGKGSGRKGRGTGGATKDSAEYVAGLTGLTDAEREEMKALMDKREALGEGEKLSDTDRARMSELRRKARNASAKEAIEADTSLTNDQKSSLKSKLDDLADVEAKIEDYLSDPTYKKLEEQRSEDEEALGSYIGHGGRGGHHRMG